MEMFVVVPVAPIITLVLRHVAFQVKMMKKEEMFASLVNSQNLQHISIIYLECSKYLRAVPTDKSVQPAGCDLATPLTQFQLVQQLAAIVID